jgi:YspA, cpYpsA-related SLOG family
MIQLPQIVVQRLLVTGGRDFTDGDYVFRWLQLLQLRYQFRLLIHGGARGVDSLADCWARSNGVQPCRCDALWPYWRSRGSYKAAGAIRNGDMLILQPHLVVAFPGHSGTANMLEQAEKAKVHFINLADDYVSAAADE